MMPGSMFPDIVWEVLDPYERITVSPTPAGFLRCINCRSNWCDHLSMVLEKNMDGWSLWKQIDFEQTLFQIPMRPTGGLYAQVQFHRTDNPDAVKVYCVLETTKRATQLDPFVGFLNRGEGRIHIRQMLISWFEPEVDTRLHGYACTSPNHSFTREMAFQNLARMPDRTVLFENCWRILFQGRCNTCGGESSHFPDDLVPVR